MDIIKIKCKQCKEEYVLPSEDDCTCPSCRSQKVSIIELKSEDYLNYLDAELEGANYHDFCGLGSQIFDAVKSLVDSRDRLKLAKAISEEIYFKI